MTTMPTENELWFIWLDDSRHSSVNMAIDELLYQECKTFRNPLIRIYQWERKSISIGYFQHYDNTNYRGYTIVRRPTGGGVVNHQKDLTYSLTIPSNHGLFNVSRRECYHKISTTVITGLSYLNITAKFAEISTTKKGCGTYLCFETPAEYDVILDGHKIAGAAQKRNKHGLLHQGSINRETLTDTSFEALKDSFLTGFKEVLNCNFQTFNPSPDLLIRANELADSKYASAAWNKKR